MHRAAPAPPLLTLGEALRLGSERLRQAGIDSPALDMSLLLGKALNLTRLQVYTNLDRPLIASERAEARELLARRLRREPMAYIMGEKEFFGLAFKVSPDVLIPRPETERMVELARDFLLGDAAPTGPVLDLGTGSGAIAVALSKALDAPGKERTCIATDVSEPALSIARENAMRHGAAERIAFLDGDLFAPLTPGMSFAAILSNPPYIADAERATLEPDVGEHEPQVALFAGEDGLAVLRQIITSAGDWLAGNGLLALECGHQQANRVEAILSAAGHWERIKIHPDLAGIGRHVTAYRSV